MPFTSGLGGQMRFSSSSERVLRIAMEHAAGLGAVTMRITGARLDLPTYDPALDPTPAAEYVIDAIERADGVILASPSYHGGMTGLLKNTLDHLETLAGLPRPHLRDRLCALVATGYGWPPPHPASPPSIRWMPGATSMLG